MIRGWMAGLMWLAVAVAAVEAKTAKTAVVFVGGVHSRYVVKPLTELGIAVDVCAKGKLAAKLADGQFNVAVVGTMVPADRAAAEAFVRRRGGVLACSPEGSAGDDWTNTNRWLAGFGARPRWEVLADRDPNNCVTDIMRCRLSFTDDVAPEFADGVKGLLTLMWRSTGGCSPPMSFDLTDDWRVIARGSKTMHSTECKRHDVPLAPWKPKRPIESAPPLAAVRSVGKGRLAVLAVRRSWLFAPPTHCPTAESMLTTGAGGRESDYLRLTANMIRWLAEPSLTAGLGGAETPAQLVDPRPQVWAPRPQKKWDVEWKLSDQRQTPGLVGARTALSGAAGSVADYAKAARAAGLGFLVFLEDSLKMDQATWDKLVAECAAASDDDFSAVPGLTYEDAQGNHLYAFADEVAFPKPEMLLPDGRLATTRSIRTKAYFKYVNELMRQHILSGFWRHGENEVPPVDYKLYNSFPIVTHEGGKAVGEALDTYAYLQGIGGCQAALAIEIMTDPSQVARRAKTGWRVVAHRGPAELRTKWHHGAWSFSGSGSQYITNGPEIAAWQAPNRLTEPRGQRWRPDLWQWRVGIRARSDVGLKSVTIHDGDRGVFRRWLCGGRKEFEARVVLANCRQLGLFPVVEDVRGRRAIGMSFWNRNLNMEEFLCSDRCNVLGNCRLRGRRGGQTWIQVSFQGNMGITPSKGLLHMQASPAVCLSPTAPTLPIDGRPMGFPTATLHFRPRLEGELDYLFAWPQTYLVGPEIAIGQADIRAGYDPAEKGAAKTRLGHTYEQPQLGWGNSWGSWHRLVETRVLAGWMRLAACNWMPGTFRSGWQQSDLKLKREVLIPEGGLRVASCSTPGWALYRGGRRVGTPGVEAAAKMERGVYAVLEHVGGGVVVAGLDGPLTARVDKHGRLDVHYTPPAKTLAAGEAIRYTLGFGGADGRNKLPALLGYARAYGLAGDRAEGFVSEVRRGKVLGDRLIWRVQPVDGALEATLRGPDLPGLLPTRIEGLNDNWAVWLVDRKRTNPNVRALPVRDGVAYAQLDPAGGDMDVFIGHPVVCSRDDVTLQVAWMAPGVWFVEAHNPTDKLVETTIRTVGGWPKFSLTERVALPAGASRIWHVREP